MFEIIFCNFSKRISRIISFISLMQKIIGQFLKGAAAELKLGLHLPHYLLRAISSAWRGSLFRNVLPRKDIEACESFLQRLGEQHRHRRHSPSGTAPFYARQLHIYDVLQHQYMHYTK